MKTFNYKDCTVYIGGVAVTGCIGFSYAPQVKSEIENLEKKQNDCIELRREFNLTTARTFSESEIEMVYKFCMNEFDSEKLMDNCRRVLKAVYMFKTTPEQYIEVLRRLYL